MAQQGAFRPSRSIAHAASSAVLPPPSFRHALPARPSGRPAAVWGAVRRPAARHGPGRGDLPRGPAHPGLLAARRRRAPGRERLVPHQLDAAGAALPALAGGSGTQQRRRGRTLPAHRAFPPFGRHPFLLSRYGGLAGRTWFRGGGPHACPRLHAQHGSAAYLAAVRRPPERGEHPHRPAAAP